jgi:hypothetical protein
MIIRDKNPITVERIYPDRFSIIEEAIKQTDTPSLLGYHTSAYMIALTEVLHDNPLYLVAFFEEKVAGFLPLRWCHGMLGIVINGLPFFGPNGGPVLTTVGFFHAENTVTALCNALHEIANDLDAVSVALYTPFLYDSAILQLAFKPDRVIERFTQYLAIPDAPIKWPTRSRRAVTRAQKKDCLVRSGTIEDLKELLEIYKENCTAAHIPLKPDEYFYQIVNNLCETGIARFTLAECDGSIAACLITIQCAKTISYNVPCSRIKERTIQANSMLIDEAVHHAQKLGYKYWNWEASPSREHPVYEFKRNWGAIESNYYIMLRYPKGLKSFKNITAQEIASSYPYYFVKPFDDFERKNVTQ